MPFTLDQKCKEDFSKWCPFARDLWWSLAQKWSDQNNRKRQVLQSEAQIPQMPTNKSAWDFQNTALKEATTCYRPKWTCQIDSNTQCNSAMYIIQSKTQ